MFIFVDARSEIRGTGLREASIPAEMAAIRFREKREQLKTFSALLPERPESGLDCLACAVFPRQRSRTTPPPPPPS